ncbi:MAG: hypothetical protein FWD30_04030 [Dehalococcoidia bacterium]|nr:hypothetical protein [Dehalococcoidia bacterium]
MQTKNTTLLISPESRDLVFDEEGLLVQIQGDDTTAQNVRLTLQSWLGEFFLDITFGTDYGRILGKKPFELSSDEAGEVLREAIFQEPGMAQIDEVKTQIDGRSVKASFIAQLASGNKIGLNFSHGIITDGLSYGMSCTPVSNHQ